MIMISDGTDEAMGLGKNVCFCYDDMVSYGDGRVIYLCGEKNLIFSFLRLSGMDNWTSIWQLRRRWIWRYARDGGCQPRKWRGFLPIWAIQWYVYEV